MADEQAVTEKDQRDAAVAAVLAPAVRDGEVHTADALRIIKHEMRRRNTNKKIAIKRRSVQAQQVIDKYTALGQPPPNNNSDEALHADHVYPIREEELRNVTSADNWVHTLLRLREVVCVTAKDNYRLEAIERTGITGPAKCLKANITWAGTTTPAEIEVDVTDEMQP